MEQENHRHHKQLRDEIDKSPKKNEVLRPVVGIPVAGIPGGARARALHSLASEAAPGAWLSKVAVWKADRATTVSEVVRKKIETNEYDSFPISPWSRKCTGKVITDRKERPWKKADTQAFSQARAAN